MPAATLVAPSALSRQSTVPEHWIVDPFAHTVTHLTRGTQGSYESTVQDKHITVSILPSLSLDLGRVW